MLESLFSMHRWNPPGFITEVKERMGVGSRGWSTYGKKNPLLCWYCLCMVSHSVVPGAPTWKNYSWKTCIGMRQQNCGIKCNLNRCLCVCVWSREECTIGLFWAGNFDSCLSYQLWNFPFNFFTASRTACSQNVNGFKMGQGIEYSKKKMATGCERAYVMKLCHFTKWVLEGELLAMTWHFNSRGIMSSVTLKKRKDFFK